MNQILEIIKDLQKRADYEQEHKEELLEVLNNLKNLIHLLSTMYLQNKFILLFLKR